MVQAITDARRKRQVELTKQEHRKDKGKTHKTPENPEASSPQVDPSGTSPETSGVTPGGSGINIELLQHKLFRQNQLERAELLIDIYASNM